MQDDKRNLGTPQPWWLKLLLGGLLLLVLVLLIWGPLLVISIGNLSNQPNPPVGVGINLRLNGFQVGNGKLYMYLVGYEPAHSLPSLQ